MKWQIITAVKSFITLAPGKWGGHYNEEYLPYFLYQLPRSQVLKERLSPKWFVACHSCCCHRRFRNKRRQCKHSLKVLTIDMDTSQKSSLIVISKPKNIQYFDEIILNTNIKPNVNEHFKLKSFSDFPMFGFRHIFHSAIFCQIFTHVLYNNVFQPWHTFAIVFNTMSVLKVLCIFSL
jgi:hypothetical protein